MSASRFPLSAILALTLAACSWGTSSREDFAREHPFASSAVFEPTVLASALGDLKKQIGSADPRVKSVSLWRTYVTLDAAQDPKKPTHFDDYNWNDGSLSKPSPNSLRANGIAGLQAELFSLSEAPLTDVRPFVKTAFASVKVEDGVVTRVDVRRGWSIGVKPSPLVITVSITGPRGSASVELDASGKVLKVNG
ncbi:MAG: hypothetical protein ACHREM_18955 [Polyangiales bacterium]